ERSARETQVYRQLTDRGTGRPLEMRATAQLINARDHIFKLVDWFLERWNGEHTAKNIGQARTLLSKLSARLDEASGPESGVRASIRSEFDSLRHRLKMLEGT